MLALGTSADLEIGGPIRVNVRRKEKLIGVVTNRSPVGEFDDGKTVIEQLLYEIGDPSHYLTIIRYEVKAKPMKRLRLSASAFAIAAVAASSSCLAAR